MSNPYFENLFKLDENYYAKLANDWWKNNPRKEYHKMFNINMFNRDKVKKVIFNQPATIVYWGDGTKTVVKAQNGDGFDREKGFAMACTKKFFGNQGNYYNMFREHGADEIPIKFDTCYNVEFPDYDYNAATKEEIEKELRIDSPVPETYVKIPTLDVEPVGRTKSDYIIEKIKEFTRDFWMLKVYSELDTEEWVLDIGVMNNDIGKSMRYIMNLEDVEWERIDEIIGRITSSIANELIPSVWEKGE
jgi:hypothetical protein